MPSYIAFNLIDCSSKLSGTLEAIMLAIITLYRGSIHGLPRLSSPLLPISRESKIHALLISTNNRQS